MGVDYGSDVIFVGDVAEQFVDENRSARVEAGVGLVAEKIFGIHCDGTSDSHALLHTARYFRRILVFGTLEIDTFEAEAGAVEHLAVRHASVDGKGKHHIAEHCLRVEKSRALKEHTYFLAYLLDLLAVHLHEVAAVVEYLTLLGAYESHERLEHHGLARAALTYDKIGLSGEERSGDVIEDSLAVKRFCEILYFDHCSRSLVSTTSSRSMRMEEATTALVLALPTSSAPPFTK